MADDLLSEIFANLISNSVTFGGPFVTIWVQAKQTGETITVTVADNGPGIPDLLKPKLFINSSKGSSRGNAKGLGLYIVKMLLDRYGGKIKVNDRVANATDKFHSTTGRAANIALKAGVKRLLIGHYSARYDNLQPLLDEARAVFPDTELAVDGCIFNI